MANEPELKELFASIEAEEQQMANYRSRLAPKLSKKARRSYGSWLGWGLIPVALAAWLLVFLAPDQFPQSRLDEVMTLVQSEGESSKLLEKARILQKDGNERNRLNATMVLCLLEDRERAVEWAALGLQQDPRAEFRVHYLEFLLDYADEYEFNVARVEWLLDEETDSVCIQLYKQILKIARLEGSALS